MVYFIFAAVILLSLGVCRHAAAKYVSAVREGRRIPSPENRTGAEIALEFLRSQGAEDMRVIQNDGVISDYFDSKRRCLYLRRASMEGKDLAAWGIALHEAGHALQSGKDKEAFKWRRQCIAMCRYLPTVLFFVCIVLLVLLKMKVRLVFVLFAGSCASLLLMNMGSMAIEFHANELLRRWLDQRLGKYPTALEKLEPILTATATRELGDLMSSPRFFFLSALPGTGGNRPT